MRYTEILTRTEAALAAGRISERDLEHLLQRRADRPGSARPDTAGVLAAIGLMVAFLGVALLFGLRWHDLHGGVRVLSPFLFPAAALALAVGLSRSGRPVWQSELAGIVGFVALVLAFLAAADAFHPRDNGLFGVVAAAIGTAAVVALHLQLRNARLTGWGLSVALVALTGSAAAYAGAGSHDVARVMAGHAAVAGAIGALLFARSRLAAVPAIRTSLLLWSIAAVDGTSGDGYQHLSVWHAVISLTVVAAFVLSSALELDGLVWVGALASLAWLGMLAAVIGSSAGWAIALLLAGAGLVGLALLVAGVRRRRTPIG